MRIFFEDRLGIRIKDPSTSRHIMESYHYDRNGDFHLVLRKRGSPT